MYGVPEVKESDVPIPLSLGKCGLKIDGRIPESVENILVDSVRPVLPNLFVKPIAIADRNAKQILVVHHPGQLQ